MKFKCLLYGNKMKFTKKTDSGVTIEIFVTFPTTRNLSCYWVRSSENQMARDRSIILDYTSDHEVKAAIKTIKGFLNE